MIKKAVIIGGVLLLVGVVLASTDAVSYVRTSAGYVSETVHEAVPIEFQIERARGMIQDLIPEVKKNMYVIAKEEVEVKRLEEQIRNAEARLADEKQQILRLKSDLSDGRDVYRYAGRSFTVVQVKVDLANRFERYKTGDATAGSLREIHVARTQSLEAARQKLEGMLASKRQLEVEVENLGARLQMIEAAQTTSEFQFDDSRLGRVKGLINDLRTRLDVAERLVHAKTQFYGEIPLDASTPENIVNEVTDYFGRQAPTVAEVAAD